MQIDVEARQFPPIEAPRSHAARRLRATLVCCGERIRGTAMRLSDVGRPSGGVDNTAACALTRSGQPNQASKGIRIWHA